MTGHSWSQQAKISAGHNLSNCQCWSHIGTTWTPKPRWTLIRGHTLVARPLGHRDTGHTLVAKLELWDTGTPNGRHTLVARPLGHRDTRHTLVAKLELWDTGTPDGRHTLVADIHGRKTYYVLIRRRLLYRYLPLWLIMIMYDGEYGDLGIPLVSRLAHALQSGT